MSALSPSGESIGLGPLERLAIRERPLLQNPDGRQRALLYPLALRPEERRGDGGGKGLLLGQAQRHFGHRVLGGAARHGTHSGRKFRLQW